MKTCQHRSIIIEWKVVLRGEVADKVAVIM